MHDNFDEKVKTIEEFLYSKEIEDKSFLASYFYSLEGAILKQEKETIYKVFTLFRDAIENGVFVLDKENKFLTLEESNLQKLLIEFSFIGYDLEDLSYNNTSKYIVYIQDINLGELDKKDKDFVSYHLQLLKVYKLALDNNPNEKHYQRIYKRIKETLDIQIKKDWVKETLVEYLNNRLERYNETKGVMDLLKLKNAVKTLTMLSKEFGDNYSQVINTSLKFIQEQESLFLFIDYITEYESLVFDVENEIIQKTKEIALINFSNFKKNNSILEKEDYKTKLEDYLIEKRFFTEIV